MTFPPGLRALNHRDFRVFYAGQAVSLVGTWMQTVGQAWLVLQLTDSPFRLGLIGTLQFAPLLLLSVVGGAVADRLPKRRLLMATQSALALLALTLATLVVTGHVAYWHVAVLAVLMGCVNTLDQPARQSFIVELVGRGDLGNAIGLNSALFNSARVVGPSVAGLLIARYGMAIAFFLNAASFLGLIVALGALSARGLPAPRAGTTMGQEIGAGLRYVLATPRVRVVLAILFVVSLCVFNFAVFVPLYARQALGEGAEGFGFLMAAVGVGAVGGALTLAATGHRTPPLRRIVTGAAVACASLLVLAAVRDFRMALVVLFVVGFSGILTVASCNTTLQLAAPDALRGRVMSLYALVFGGSFPVGAFVVGAVTERWGIATALLANGGLGLGGLGMVVGWWVLRRRRERA